MRVCQEKVKEFFDQLAPGWDAGRETHPERIEAILDRAEIGPWCAVLDAACGTGVLFPYCLRRGVRQLTGADLSGEMIRIARERCRDPRLRLLEGDVLKVARGSYDRIIVFNALPHFPDPEGLLAALGGWLTPGGRLTVAHDKSRLAINGHHQRTASLVSMGLAPAEETAELFPGWMTVDRVEEDDTHYLVSGRAPEEGRNLR